MNKVKKVLFFTAEENAKEDYFFQAIEALLDFFRLKGSEFQYHYLWPLPTEESAIESFRAQEFDLIFLCLRPATPGFSKRVYDLLTEEQRKVLICIGHSVTEETRGSFDSRLFAHTLLGEVNIDTYVQAIAAKLKECEDGAN
ncbi:hypothetical protein HQ571_00575 [Candidatus Kuenenbacteria bacterium]|nr:hypothetical protein [Candidatus Kuenenbacteria bacterium]